MAAPAASTGDKGEASVGFMFDLIVVRVDCPKENFENPKNLSVDVNFKNVDLQITSSRINVVEFRAGRSYEFEEKPSALQQNLQKNTLKLTVKYCDKVVGKGEVIWPDPFIDRISACAGELTHCAEADIKDGNGTKTGSVEIIARLQTKCLEFQEEKVPRVENVCTKSNPVIDPNDILFVVGEEKSACCCSEVGIIPASDSDTAISPACLDLSSFRGMNGKTITDPEVINEINNFSQMQQVADQYKNMMTSIGAACNFDKPHCSRKPNYDFGGNFGPCPSAKDKCGGSSGGNCMSGSMGGGGRSAGGANSGGPRMSGGGIGESNILCGCHRQEPDPCKFRKNFKFHREEGGFDEEKFPQVIPLMDPPELTEDVVHGHKYCQICKEDITWLPKMAACPKCHYKPIPVIEEKSYNDMVTADQILQDYLEKKSSSFSMKDPFASPSKCSDHSPVCRCTCEAGKICAHCRIRKMCEDIFQPEPAAAMDTCNKCEVNSSELFNICPQGDQEEDCRPYLSRVFSELRDLFDLKDSVEKEPKKNERCEAQLQGKPKGKQQAPPSKGRMSGGQCVELELSDDGSPESQFPNSNTQDHGQEHTEMGNAVSGSNSRSPESAYISPKSNKKLKKKEGGSKGGDKSARSGKSKKNYDYRTVRKTPRHDIGHKTCVNGYATGRKNVPSNMGWLWNLEAKGNRAGWKPGAIRKPIKQLMKYFLKDFPADTLRVSQYSYRKGGGEGGKNDGQENEEIEQKPTLHIFKKNGEYTITMRPLKDTEALKQCANPYMEMEPIQFKITKNPIVVQMRNLKAALKDMGFAKCTCHRPLSYCYCRSFLDKKRLEYQCNKECRKRQIPKDICEKLILSDTTESDVEFDFGVTPPAGVVKQGRSKPPDLVNHGTQYTEGDWNIPVLYPKEPNKYMKLYNCAIGERFGKKYTPYGEKGYKPGAQPAGAQGGKGGGGGGRGGGGKTDTKGGSKGGKGGGGRSSGGGTGGAGGRSAGGAGGAGGNSGGRGAAGGGKGGAGGGADGPGGRDKGGKGGGGIAAGDGTVDMMKYLKKSEKDAAGRAGDKKKKYGYGPPPLLCQVDRRGKPVDPCAQPFYYPCEPAPPCRDVCYGCDRQIWYL